MQGRASTAQSFSEEIWSLIFSFCLERGEEGCHVPQPTLSSAIRVNKTLFLAATPYLYRNPVVYDIASFFLGADRPVPTSTTTKVLNPDHIEIPSDIEYLNIGHTKLSQLRHVRRLTIIAYLRQPNIPQANTDPQAKIDGDGDDDSGGESENGSEKPASPTRRSTMEKILYQDAFFETALKTLLNAGDDNDEVITPRLEKLTIGSCIYPDSLSEEEILEAFNENLLKIRDVLLHKLGPKYWCEYNLKGGLKSQALDCILDRYLPKVVTQHKELGYKDRFTVCYGTTNRIMVRLYVDANPEDDPRKKDEDRNQPLKGPGDLTPRTRANIIAAINGIPLPGSDEDENSGQGVSSDTGQSHTLPAISFTNPQGELDPYFTSSFWTDPLGLKKHDAVDVIMKSMYSSYPRWLRTPSSIKTRVDNATRIEIYGLEKVLRGWHPSDEGLRDYDDLFEDSDTDTDSGFDTDSDFWHHSESEDDSGTEEASASPIGHEGPGSTREEMIEEDIQREEIKRLAKAERIQKRKKRALEKIEELVQDQINGRFNERFWTKECAPSVRLFLAKDAPACESCGQGEKDKWVWNPLDEIYR